jgi:hypothetical protein
MRISPLLTKPLSTAYIYEIESRPLGLLTLEEHFLRSPHPDVFFIFLEKVGCTFIKHLLVHEMIGDVSRIDPEYYLPGLQPINIVHALSHEALRVDGRDVLSSQSANTITFCRNPYARFISAYLDKIVDPPALELPYFCWIRREILFRKARSAVAGKAIEWADRITLREFAEFIQSQPAEQRDKHWAEQWSLNLADMVEHQEIIRIERFKEDLPVVWRKYFGRDIPTGPSFLRNTTKVKLSLDKDTADIIYAIYEKDFEIFGYDAESWRSI